MNADDVVVDVGGNVGTVTLALAKAFPKPRFVVQDLDKVIPDAEGVSWLQLYLRDIIFILISFGKPLIQTPLPRDA